MPETIQPISELDASEILQKLVNSNAVIKLNVGCGNNKLEEYINIDLNKDNKPDVVLDIKQGIPLPDKSVTEIVFFHTIEHIQEIYHLSILMEFWRILKPGGLLFISYPEFKKCAQRYIDNYQGAKLFWKHTIYGLQRSEGDFHVSLMDTELFIDTLREAGFTDIEHQPEKNEPFNTIIKAVGGDLPNSYEDVLKNFVFN